MNELALKEHPKILIKENITFGLFSKKYKKEFEDMMETFKEDTAQHTGVQIDILVSMMKSIKEFCEKHLKGQYTDIYITVEKYYYGSSWDDDSTPSFGVVLGRYETDIEWEKRLSEQRDREKRYEEEQLLRDAKKLIELQKKFKVNEKVDEINTEKSK